MAGFSVEHSTSSGQSSGASQSTSTPVLMDSAQSNWGLMQSQLLSALADRTYNWAMQQYAKGEGVTDQTVANFMEMSGKGKGLADTLMHQYQDQIKPLMDQYIRDAGSYASEGRQRFEAGRAMSTVAQADEAAIRAAQDKIAGYGGNVNAGRTQDMIIASRISDAQARAGAGTQAALQTEATGRQMTENALKMGQQIPGQAMGAIQSAYAGLTGAESAILGLLNAGQNLAQTAAPYHQAAVAANKLPPVAQQQQATSAQQSTQGSQSDKQSQQTDKEGGQGKGQGDKGKGPGQGQGQGEGEGAGPKRGPPLNITPKSIDMRGAPKEPKEDDGTGAPVDPYEFVGPPIPVDLLGKEGVRWDDPEQGWGATNPDEFVGPQQPFGEFGVRWDDPEQGWNTPPPVNEPALGESGVRSEDPEQGWGGYDTSRSAADNDVFGGQIFANYGSNAGSQNASWEGADEVAQQSNDQWGGQNFSNYDAGDDTSDWTDAGDDSSGYDDNYSYDAGDDTSDWTDAGDDSSGYDDDYSYDAGDDTSDWTDAGDDSGYDDNYSYDAGDDTSDWTDAGDDSGYDDSGYDDSGYDDYYDSGYSDDFAQGGPVRARLRMARGGVMPTTGGAVPRSASPSRGQQTDDISARLNAGEYVIPRDVVKHQGTKFFTDLIAKSRKLRTGMTGAKPGPTMRPALPQGRPTFRSRPLPPR
jgi:hypothetical protein